MSTPADSKLRLYELVVENGRSASPYVWRTRYALAHKGLEFESVPLGFTEIPRVFAGRFKTVPVITDGHTMLAESWDIAEYLDQAYPRSPRLFSGDSEIATLKLLDAWLHAEILRRMFRLYLLDIHNAARPEDRSYFRASREQRLRGRSLEEFLGWARQELRPVMRRMLALCDAEDILRAERFDGNGCHERGVDAAGESDEGLQEAALADVVAGAEDEGAKNGFVFVAGLGVHVAGERFGVDEDEIFFE